VKPRYVVACLLCFLLFVAALDLVPDPPVVNPHTSEVGQGSLHIRGVSALQQEILVFSESSHYARKNSSPYGLTIDIKLLGPCQLLLVRHAADPSPPILFRNGFYRGRIIGGRPPSLWRC
jgi:hypothetical protein